MNDEEKLLDEVLNSVITINNGTLLSSYPISGSALTSSNVISSITAPKSQEDPLDEYVMNRVTIDHKVTAQELLKLQSTAPDYATEIKEAIAKEISREVSKKVSYKKKHDKDTDVHHFIGRVWVFSDEELKAILGK